MDKLYLIELIEYYYDGYSEDLNQETPEVLGVYKTKGEYTKRVELEIDNYKKVSKTEIKIMRDEELVEGCMESFDIVSSDSRVNIVVTEIVIGSSNKLIDYNRINYILNYEETQDVEIINIKQ